MLTEVVLGVLRRLKRWHLQATLGNMKHCTALKYCTVSKDEDTDSFHVGLNGTVLLKLSLAFTYDQLIKRLLFSSSDQTRPCDCLSHPYPITVLFGPRSKRSELVVSNNRLPSAILSVRRCTIPTLCGTCNAASINYNTGPAL